MKNINILISCIFIGNLISFSTSSLAVSEIFAGITNSSDDGEELLSGPDTGKINLSNDKLPVETSILVGLRFTDVFIPKNAVVKNSYIEFLSQSNQAESSVFFIVGEKIANSPVFATESYNLSSRTKTSAFKAWEPLAWDAGNPYQTSNISSLVQEIIDQPGWSESNAMSFFLSGEGLREAESFESDSSAIATLYVEYGLPGMVQFSASSYSVNENEGSINITVSRTGGSDGAVSIDYSDIGTGSAAVGNDYVEIIKENLSWADGEVGDKTFSVLITDDAMLEEDETIALQLEISSGEAILGTSTATLTITDDEVCSPTITVTAISDSGPGTLREALANVCESGTIQFGPSLTDQIITLTNELIIDKEVSIKNPLAKNLTLSGSNTTRVFLVQSSGHLTLENLIITHGYADEGAGIYNSGVLDVINSTFSNNKSLVDCSSCYGGGIYNDDGTVNIVNSSFINNEVSSDSGVGGAIGSHFGTITVSNSTFFGNQANEMGGAIYSDGIADIINSTFFDNQALSYGGIAVIGQLHLKNTIIAQSTGGDCDESGEILTNKNNWIEDASCSSLFSGDPKLGPLQNNGGPTQTLALLLDSPAINVGDPEICAADPVNQLDQRGISRPSECDIGAFELVPICVVQSQIPLTECEALVTFYDSTDGPNWFDSPGNNWTTSITPCSWNGITCDGGHIVGIDRQNQNLRGSISEMAAFTALQSLNLASNHLISPIPDFSSLNQLQSLSLSQNQLMGEIPPGSNFPASLELLSLDHNQLTGEIPASLTSLIMLSTLDLGYNQLTVNPADTELLNFLENKASGWANSQTIPPTNIKAVSLSESEIQLTWTPIPYQSDGGYYRIKYATLAGGPYQVSGFTADKSASNYVVTNLLPDTTYYFSLETYTPAHDNQQSELISFLSTEVQGKTPSAGYASLPAPQSTLDFGNTAIGKEVTLDFKILNIGDSMLEVSLDKLTGIEASDFKVMTTDFPLTLHQLGEVTTVTLQCTPSGIGLRSAQLQLTTNDPKNPLISYTLECTGQKPAGYASTPAPANKLNLGSGFIGKSLSRDLRITETGDENLEVNLISITGSHADNFKVVTQRFPLIIPNGGSAQTITVKCAPSEIGLHTALLQLSSNDLARPTPTYDLECTGVAPVPVTDPSIDKPESILDFGESLVGTPITLDLPITTYEKFDLIVDIISFTGEHADDFQVLTANLPLVITKDGEIQTITLQCLPSETGLHTATLELRSQSGTSPTLSYPLRCRGGLVPNARYSSTPPPKSTLDFGQTMIGTPITLNWTISERGNLDLELDLVAMTGEQATDFQILSPSFPITLAEGDDPLTVTVQCTPSNPGLRTALLELSSNDSLNPSPTYTLQCIGEAVGIAAYDSMPAANSLLEVGSSEIGTPAMATLIVSEKGTEPLEVFKITLEGENANDFTLPDGITSLVLPDGSPDYPLAVQCIPSDLGQRRARLTLITNDPNNLKINYDLVCTGLALSNSNRAPTDITLSSNRVDEDSPGGIFIGTFSTTDPDNNDTHTYLLQQDEWGVFELQDNNLLLHPSTQLDFEKRPYYPIVVRSTDAEGLFIEKQFTIQVNNVPETQFIGEIITGRGKVGNQASIDAPEHVKLMGYIEPTRKDIGQWADILMTYHWTPEQEGQSIRVPVTLAKHVALQPRMEFTLFKGRLIGLSGVFEVSLGYRLKGDKLVSASVATLTVRSNRIPLDINLSDNTVQENSPADTLIGTLTTQDPDNKDWFSYGLVDDSQGHFKIVGNELRTTQLRLNHEDSAQRQIIVRSVDSSGNSIDKTFTIEVIDVETELVDIHLTREEVLENSSSGTVVGKLVTQDREPGTYIYELLDDAQGRFKLVEDLLLVAEGTHLDFETQATYSITVRSQKLETGQSIEKNFTIKVINLVDVNILGEVRDTRSRLLSTADLKTNQKLTIRVQLIPDVKHRGQQADLVCVAVYLRDHLTVMYMLNGKTWTEWNGELATLRATESVTLQAHHDLILWQDKFADFAKGDLKIFGGYRLASGEIVYSPDSFDIRVR